MILLIDNKNTVFHFRKNRVIGVRFDQYSVEISIDNDKDCVYTKLYKDDSFTDLVMEKYDELNHDIKLPSYVKSAVQYYEEKSYEYGKELYDWNGQVEE